MDEGQLIIFRHILREGTWMITNKEKLRILY